MTKLAQHGVSGRHLDWIQEFLIGRKQWVRVVWSFAEWIMHTLSEVITCPGDVKGHKSTNAALNFHPPHWWTNACSQ